MALSGFWGNAAYASMSYIQGFEEKQIVFLTLAIYYPRMLSTYVNELNDVLATVQASSDTAQIVETFSAYLKRIGFEYYSYFFIHPNSRPGSIFVASSYPDEWKRHYKEESYIDTDPVVRAAWKAAGPFSWENALKPTTSLQHRKFLHEAIDAGISVGGTIPLRGPGQGFASFSVAVNEGPEKFLKLWNEREHELRLLSAYVHERMICLNDLDRHVLSPYRLTPREKECLLWTARGCTAWSIGEILDLSESTVETYLANACKKLGVNSKIRAVVIAIGERLIFP